MGPPCGVQYQTEFGRLIKNRIASDVLLLQCSYFLRQLNRVLDTRGVLLKNKLRDCALLGGIGTVPEERSWITQETRQRESTLASVIDDGIKLDKTT